MAKKKTKIEPGVENYVSAFPKIKRWNYCQKIAVLLNRSSLTDEYFPYIYDRLQHENILNKVLENLLKQ